jgi:hypothetical protein
VGRKSKLLSILPKCRQLLKPYRTSHLVQKHFRASKVIMLINFPAIMHYVLLVDVQVRDSFAQLLYLLKKWQKSELHGCCSINLVLLQPAGGKGVIKSSSAAAASCSVSSCCYPYCYNRKTSWIGNLIDVIGWTWEVFIFCLFLKCCIQLTIV